MLMETTLYEPCLWEWAQKDNSMLINVTKWRKLIVTAASCQRICLVSRPHSIIKLLLFANSVPTLLDKIPLLQLVYQKKFADVCLRSCILALCATNIHQASAQSISNNPSCNQYHTNIYQGGQGGGSGDGEEKKCGHGSAVSFAKSMHFKSNDEWWGEKRVCGNGNLELLSPSRGGLQHSRHFAGMARAWCLPINDLWPLSAFIIHLSCWFVVDTKVQCYKPSHPQMPLGESGVWTHWYRIMPTSSTLDPQ